MNKKERQAEIDRLLKEVNANRTKLGKPLIGIYQESKLYTPHTLNTRGSYDKSLNTLTSVIELIAYLKGMLIMLKGV